MLLPETFRTHAIVQVGPVAEWHTPNDMGYVENWVTRLVRSDAFGDTSPCIEFYSADTNQFVSDYYVSTLAGMDPSFGLDLWGDVHAWTIEGRYLVEILDWMNSAVQSM